VHEALARVTARVGAGGLLSGRKSCAKAARTRHNCARTRCPDAAWRNALQRALPGGLRPPIRILAQKKSPDLHPRAWRKGISEKVRARLPFRQRRETTDPARDEKGIYEK